MELTNELWRISAHHQTINDRAIHRGNVHCVPDAWAKFAGYDVPSTSKDVPSTSKDAGYDDYRKKQKTAPQLASVAECTCM